MIKREIPSIFFLKCVTEDLDDFKQEASGGYNWYTSELLETWKPYDYIEKGVTKFNLVYIYSVSFSIFQLCPFWKYPVYSSRLLNKWVVRIYVFFFFCVKM